MKNRPLSLFLYDKRIPFDGFFCKLLPITAWFSEQKQ